jgi:hypothetical protein
VHVPGRGAPSLPRASSSPVPDAVGPQAVNAVATRALRISRAVRIARTTAGAGAERANLLRPITAAAAAR